MSHRPLRLASGEVVTPREGAARPGVTRHLRSALRQIATAGRDFIIHQVDYARVIGRTTCVETGASDNVVFAWRHGKKGPSRFVIGRKPEPCRSLVVVLKKAEDGYDLLSAFIGSKAEPEPWNRNAQGWALLFWASHALVWGSEAVVDGTETNEVPGAFEAPQPAEGRWLEGVAPGLPLELEPLKWALELAGKTLEWRTRDGRHIQLSGHQGVAGGWVRHFHPYDHPTRSRLGAVGVAEAFEDAASPFVLFSSTWADGILLTRDQLLSRVKDEGFRALNN
jgi:hypothetical protein